MWKGGRQRAKKMKQRESEGGDSVEDEESEIEEGFSDI